jgi:phage-related protein
MQLIRESGVRGSRHLRGELYEVRAQTAGAHYRLIFCQVSRSVLLALLTYDKNTERTPRQVLELAQRRLSDWRARGTPVNSGWWRARVKADRRAHARRT